MTINRTHIEHATITVIVQLLLMAVFSSWLEPSLYLLLLCALPSIFLFFGREHAQRSKELAMRDDKNVDWDITLEALKIWTWDKDSLMDLLLPLLVGLLPVLLGFILLG